MSGALTACLVAAWTLAAAATAACIAQVAGEVTYVTLADGRRRERSIPLIFKLLLPFVGNLDRLVSAPAFSRQVERDGRALVAAGFDGLLDGREFVALKMLVPPVLSLLWCAAVFAVGEVAHDSAVAESRPAMFAVGIALACIHPSAWLRAAVKKRHRAIMRALPFVLDLLTLSVEAGMDFMSAIQRNCASRRLDPLNEELIRMTKEIQVGASRREALRHMADRVGQSDLRGVANALVQADELGVSIGSILRIQSDQMRARRFDMAEKLAHEAPTKMLGPLMLCIFPAVFIILLGPVLSQAMKGAF